MTQQVNHPGSLLAKELAAANLSANAFAIQLKVPTNRITSILKQQRAITPDTALRLARYFGTTAEFWLILQMNYDLKLAEAEIGDKIIQEIQPNQRFLGLC